MKIKNAVFLAALLATGSLSWRLLTRPPAPPADLRDAVSDSSAMGQLGLSPAAATAVPAPQAETVRRDYSAKAGAAQELLFTEAFSKEDILGLIGSTREGAELLGHFKRGEAELPEFIFASQLTPADKEATRSAAIMHPENLIALFIKKRDFRNNRAHIVFYKQGWPLFAVSCVVSHELQHALDRNAPWDRTISAITKSSQAKLDRKVAAQGGQTLEDIQEEQKIFGLGYVSTFLSEYLAYSRSAGVFKELATRDPGRSRLADFMKLKNNGKSIVEDDPLHNPGDRQAFFDRYFWGGNRERFKAGITAMLKNRKLVAEIRAAGLDTAISELAAYNDSPDPVTQPIHSLR